VRLYRGSIARGGGKDGYALDEVVQGPVAREIQQALTYQGGNFTTEQLYGDGGRSLLETVNRAITPKFRAQGILIEQIMPAGPPVLPEDIVGSIKGALKAQTDARRKDAELAATIAEGKKTVAQAQAEADARRLAAESIRANPEILKLEELKVHKGICPLNATTCVVGAGASTLVQAQLR
jgi:regulator of protease activity HflC (stomatin/prohibitin superfamily)